ncbi:ABC transporter permease [Amycolatopsis jiangsuensis]|uniref:ABC-2 type transport system permease protein n=1 Tax=Amycolatopsis jiangsuensis TaxID=1181879 RepID=A0A840IZW5_9PSEU|nr:ABC transporter permease [Amycolatopsis jiangsuensis]MBB4686827.1 ABC-2 type transport system permease protein [Amycolatopsis jiangsuensis]
MFAIARGELLQIFRNRLVLLTSIILPLAFSAYLIAQHGTFEKIGSIGFIAAAMLFVVVAIGFYTSVVTTLASRRQNLFLKRLRSTAVSDRSILSGLVLPLAVIALVQVGVILIVLGVVVGAPADVPMLVVAVLLTVLMMLGFGLATAGVTNSPEHAQVTTLPVTTLAIGVAVWVGITGTEQLAVLKRLLPGGAATELVVDAWNGTATWAQALPQFGPVAAWIVVSLALAARLFRWEPRR